MSDSTTAEAATEFLRKAERDERLMRSATALVQKMAGRRYNRRKGETPESVGRISTQTAHLALEAAHQAEQRRGAEAERAGASERAALQRQNVYVVGCAGQPIKIGVAASAKKRIKELQTGFPHRLRIYAEIEAHGGVARKAEAECHRRLAGLRLNGEWFDCDPYEAIDLVREVVERLKASTT